MPVVRFRIENPDHWLAWRREDITASDVGALFGAHPYKTMFGLYREKRGDLAMPERDTAQLERGQDLEPVVLEKLKKQYPSWTIKPAREYVRDPDCHLGATPDAYGEDD